MWLLFEVIPSVLTLQQEFFFFFFFLMIVLHKVSHFFSKAGRNREERGIRKMYMTTMEHNAALQAFPKAVCVCTHTQPEKSCALQRFQY